MKTKALRKLLSERDGLKCHWCDRALQLTQRMDASGRLMNDYATVDRLLPRINGGQYTPTNTVLACKLCNGGRHHSNGKWKRMLAGRNEIEP